MPKDAFDPPRMFNSIGKSGELIIRFPTPQHASVFKDWLCRSGEQWYWKDLEACEEQGQGIGWHGFNYFTGSRVIDYSDFRPYEGESDFPDVIYPEIEPEPPRENWIKLETLKAGVRFETLEEGIVAVTMGQTRRDPHLGLLILCYIVKGASPEDAGQSAQFFPDDIVKAIAPE